LSLNYRDIVRVREAFELLEDERGGEHRRVTEG
jgi:hypothetical protein